MALFELDHKSQVQSHLHLGFPLIHDFDHRENTENYFSRIQAVVLLSLLPPWKRLLPIT
jgi:hypothetical protein